MYRKEDESPGYRFSTYGGLGGSVEPQESPIHRQQGTVNMSKVATTVPGAIVIQSAVMYEGELVLETVCRDYDHYRTLPDVVGYEGTECGKTGWSSDRNYACYKSGAAIAHRK